ncbi:MAG: sensor histidine kinase [Verrucomicrobiaceae bacterium]|nr:sensor histidine kinase [Verrucomicrobiaceae bacterium]
MPRRLHLMLFFLLAPCVRAEEVLESISSIRALPPEMAGMGLRASIEATVTFADKPDGRSCLVHDGLEGIYVERAEPQPRQPLAFGTRVRLEGVTIAGGFLPAIRTEQITLLNAEGPPLKARAATGADLFSPSNDCQWVRVQAIITGRRSDRIRQMLVAEVDGWTFMLQFPDGVSLTPLLPSLMQQQVTVSGTVGTLFNRQRQLTGRYLFVPGLDHLQLAPHSTPATHLPPLRAAHELLRSDAGTRELVRVRGIVTAAMPDRIYLRDESEALMVQASITETLRPGDKVEAWGVGSLAPFRPTLRASRVQKIAPGTAPEPQPLGLDPRDLTRHHAQLSSTEAEYLTTRLATDGETVLQCRAGEWIFEARLSLAASDHLPVLSRGDLLHLTGICEITSTYPLPGDHRVDGFHLLLREAGDVRVLHPAPWWTLQRMLWLLGFVTALAVLAFIWIAQLRRRVRAQTSLITQEIERSAVKDERQRIARELHDTIEQDLAGLAIQIGTARQRIAREPAQAEASLNLAQRMLSRCRDEARTSIRDLRSVALDQRGLAGAIQDLLQPIAEEAGIQFTLKEQGKGPRPAGLQAMHLLRITQEAVINALRHAKAGSISVSLDYHATATTLEIHDDGCGFDTTAPPPRGHFGLLGIRERANKLDAVLHLESAPGSGTTLRLSALHPAPNTPPA